MQCKRRVVLLFQGLIPCPGLLGGLVNRMGTVTPLPETQPECRQRGQQGWRQRLSRVLTVHGEHHRPQHAGVPARLHGSLAQCGAVNEPRGIQQNATDLGTVGRPTAMHGLRGANQEHAPTEGRLPQAMSVFQELCVTGFIREPVQPHGRIQHRGAQRMRTVRKKHRELVRVVSVLCVASVMAEQARQQRMLYVGIDLSVE